ncbi:VirD4-like conjugal transfer protein, CD1115 family [Thomasclavelia cocleata]|uniref:VirD4-like conjugal transfer protein, CD1115 family n=1 Tax=Thomasclavelia cocleata TaxID=69824 RepID=UPI00256F2CA1|nr:type IV secretory system conjugative DNA transfer family protein [Thomasclavelia cocleata]
MKLSEFLKKNKFTVFLGICAFLIGNRLSLYYQFLCSQGKEFPIFETLNGVIESYSFSILGISIGIDVFSILWGLLGICIVILTVLYYKSLRRNYREGEEHGSARYGDIKNEGEPLKDINENNNIILSQNIQLSMNTRLTFLNNNVCIVSGSGKTFYFNEPNVLNMSCNYIITDPKLSLLPEVGKAFLQNDYDMKILDLIHIDNSMHYNPLKYINKPLDVYKFINNLVANTNDKNTNSTADPFFEKAEITFLSAVTFFIMAVASPEEQNISSIMELLDLAEASEEDENMKSPLDFMFEELDEENKMLMNEMGESSYLYKNGYAYLACLQYNLFKKAAGKTAKSVLISVGVRMSIFNLPEMHTLLDDDTIDLYTIGNPKKDCQGTLKKTVMFIGVSDSDTTLNFIAAIMYQQLFDLLYIQADSTSEHKLPIHTRFMLDEFANIGKIPDFDIKIATMRSREISVNVILQDLAQLKKNYKESWETVFGCCDTTLFLGGKDYSTWEYLSKMIGNATYDYLNISETKGSNSSVSKSNNLIQRPLIDPAEMGRLGRDECLVMIRGQHVFRDKKFNPLNHRNFNLTANADSKNLLSDDEIIHILDSAKLQNDESNEEILELTENQLFDLNIDFDDIITVDCR